MENAMIMILDENMAPAAMINSLVTLIWDRRQTEPGVFEIHCGAEDWAALQLGHYVYRSDRDELGVIRESNIEKDDSGAQQCYCKGYFAECLLYDRVIQTTDNFSGTPEKIARDIITKYVINGTGYSGRAIDFITLGAESGIAQETKNMQATGKTVADVIYGLEASEFYHKLRYDVRANKLEFLWESVKDKGAIFSDEYANIISSKYHKDVTDAPNVVYVAGSGKGKERAIVRVDARSRADEYAREIYVDARDLQQEWQDDEGNTKMYSDDDYRKMLESRGYGALYEHQGLESITVDVDENANLIYREDYDVGDLCTVKITVAGSEKFEVVKTITAAREVYEGGMQTLTITLGDIGPTSFKAYIGKVVTVNETVPAAPESEDSEEIGDIDDLTTTAKGTLVDAINELNNNIGDLSKLNTGSKDTLVGAINGTNTSLENKFNDLDNKIGSLSNLKTTNKSSIVSAINEIKNSGGGSSAIEEKTGEIRDIKYYSNPDRIRVSVMASETISLQAGDKYIFDLVVKTPANSEGKCWIFNSATSTIVEGSKYIGEVKSIITAQSIYGVASEGYAAMTVTVEPLGNATVSTFENSGSWGPYGTYVDLYFINYNGLSVTPVTNTIGDVAVNKTVRIIKHV